MVKLLRDKSINIDIWTHGIAVSKYMSVYRMLRLIYQLPLNAVVESEWRCTSRTHSFIFVEASCFEKRIIV
jgi:hypothetical protein